MKKILFLLSVVFVFTLNSCTEPKNETVEKDAPKQNLIEQNEENQNKNTDTEDELPWISGPIETPIIPPMFKDETEVDTPSDDITDNSTTESSDEQNSNEDNTFTDFILDENETPPIPIN